MYFYTQIFTKFLSFHSQHFLKGKSWHELRDQKLTVIHLTGAMETAVTETLSSIEALCCSHNLSANYGVTVSSFSLSEASTHQIAGISIALNFQQ